MKITLIYPGIVNLGFGSLGRGGMDCNWINLGLASIGACLKKNGYEVDLVDLRDQSGWIQFEQSLRDRGAAVCGVYCNTPNFNNAVTCCQIAKNLGKTVVAGGPHASIDPESLLATGFVDHVIIGEGEISLVEFMDGFIRGIPQDKVIQGKTVENLDELPFPDRELYPLKKVLNPFGNFPFIDNGLILLTSRGCPYNCAFCQPLARTMFGPRVRYRSVDNVIREIKDVLERYKVKYISFQDDTFTARKDWVLDLCRRLKEEKIVVQWSAQSRVDTFDENLAWTMSRAGCVCIFFGFESGSQRMLNFLKKGITVEQSMRAVELCRRYGILMFADYMIGIPTETEDDLKQSLNFIRKVRPEIPSLTYFTPIPGCELYSYCKEKDLIDISSYEDFVRNPTSCKVKGVDYSLLERYKNLMSRYKPSWYQESYFARLALRRWWHLARRGYFKVLLRELWTTTGFLHPGLGRYLELIPFLKGAAKE